MKNDATTQLKNLLIATCCAMDELPIIARLEFVKNIVTQNGGDKNDETYKPALALAGDVLMGVIDVLRAHKSAGQLRTPEP
jgi:hypothetical protein